MKRLLAIFLLITPAFAAPGQVPAGEYMASPAGSTGYLSPRAPSVLDWNSGTGASSSTFLRGDGTWATPSGGGGGTPGGTSGQVQYNNAGAFGGFTLGGDCTLVASTGVITCLNTNGVAFVASATTDTTNASNIGTGTLAWARVGAPVFPLTTAGVANSGGVPYFSSTTSLASSAAGAANTLMLWGGAGVAPAAVTGTGSSSQVLVGNAAGAPGWGAAPITFGATIVGGCTSGYVLYNAGGTLGCQLLAGGGNVSGPGSSTLNDIVTFGNTAGTAISDSGTLLSSLAPLASPTFTGTPAAPTAAIGTSTTQLATTAFVGTCGNQQSTSAGVGGGKCLLNTLTASSSATLNDTTSLTATYKHYDLVFNNIVPATNAVACEIQVHSSSGGAGYKSTGYITEAMVTTTTVTGSASSVTTYIPCGFGASNTVGNTGTGLNGVMTITSPSVSGLIMFGGTLNGLTNSVVMGIWQNAGYWNTSAVVDGFQVLFSSGNIASGSIEIYGWN